MNDECRTYASSPCMMHELEEGRVRRDTQVEPPRLLPARPLPPYAYLPGRFPHPVRDRDGHSFGVETEPVAGPCLRSEAFAWGIDLFNRGFYWEAHEAWEPLWRAAHADDPRRLLLKGLILLAAAGVKMREGKRAGMTRHAGRASRLFRDVAARAPELATTLDPSLGELSERLDLAVARFPSDRRQRSVDAEARFEFVLLPVPTP